jgi:RNA polymerase sigma-70 factor (ECF subfamily)
MTLASRPFAFLPFLAPRDSTRMAKDCVWNRATFPAYGREGMEPVSSSVETQEDDEQLLLRVAAGDRVAFGTLYDRFCRPLYSLAIKMLASESEAQDILQEVFLSVWKKAPMFDPARGSAFSWVVTQVRNRAIDRLRSHRRRGELIEAFGPDLDAGAEDRSASDHFETSERARQVHDALGQLTKEQRQVLRLAYFEGLTQVEIAHRLQEPLGTIKARAHRAMARLRTALRFLHD